MKIIKETDREDPNYSRIVIEIDRGGRTDISQGDHIEMTPEIELAIIEAQATLDDLMTLIHIQLG